VLLAFSLTLLLFLLACRKSKGRRCKQH
jgi:hypothetical protein